MQWCKPLRENITCSSGLLLCTGFTFVFIDLHFVDMVLLMEPVIMKPNLVFQGVGYYFPSFVSSADLISIISTLSSKSFIKMLKSAEPKTECHISLQVAEETFRTTDRKWLYY